MKVTVNKKKKQAMIDQLASHLDRHLDRYIIDMFPGYVLPPVLPFEIISVRKWKAHQ